MRFALDAGKRVGARAPYVDFVVHEEVYLIATFPKSAKDNISPAEKNEIRLQLLP